MSKTRKKNGYPSDVEALSALAVFSFSKICRALGDANPGITPYISELYLAKLTSSFQYFMEDQLGRNSPQPHTHIKLPASIFKDRSENGALYILLEILLQTLKPDESTINRFRDAALRQDNMSIYEKVKNSLNKHGHIKSRKLFFGNSVPSEMIPELEKIASQHDASIATSREAASHIVEWDEDVDGVLPEVLVEEYIRTVEIRRNDRSAVNAAAAAAVGIPPAPVIEEDPFREGTALVHWWYHPDSYDECIPAIDVDNSEIPDDLDSLEEESNAAWYVCCRFVRDVQLFNEWGNELDYELDPEKDTSAGEIVAKSAASRGRGRQGRHKRKLASTAEEKAAPPKRKIDSYSPVLEASTATEKSMGHLPPPSVGSGDTFTVLEVVPVASGNSSWEGEGEQEPPSKCQLHVDALSAVWGGDAAASSGQMEVDSEPEPKRRRLGPSRNSSVSRDALINSNLPPRADLKLPASAPSWFRADSVSATEVRYLSDFFDGSSKSRNFDTYMSTRGFMTNLYSQNTSTYLSATDCRKKLCGDAAAIIRVHSFLDTFGIINYAVSLDARPPVYPLTAASPVFGSTAFQNTQGELASATVMTNRSSGRIVWSKDDDVALMKYVLEHESDWQAIGAAMVARRSGSGITVEDCVVRFAELPVMQKCSTKSPSVVENDKDGSEMEVVGSQNGHTADEPNKDMLQGLLNEYVSARLNALEEKVKLIESVENILNVEQRRLELDRRDLQIQRAQFSFHQVQNL